jgi:NAD kinase
MNDLVVDRGSNPSMFVSAFYFPPPSGKLTTHPAAMMQMELFDDDQHYTTLLADEICIATQRGSTAYNLATGGPLSHHKNPVSLPDSLCCTV